VYPQIRGTLSPECAVSADLLIRSLSYSHFVKLLEIEDPLKRAFYEIESIRGQWSVSELERQVDTVRQASGVPAGAGSRILFRRKRILDPRFRVANEANLELLLLYYSLGFELDRKWTGCRRGTCGECGPSIERIVQKRGAVQFGHRRWPNCRRPGGRLLYRDCRGLTTLF
jgi:hypothetical protein